MGAKVKNGGVLAFRVRKRLLFTGFAGLGITGEHRTGRWALCLDGLRRLWAQQPMPEGYRWGDAEHAVLNALAARYGWDEQPYPTGWCTVIVPGEQVGIGIEVDADGALVCLPVLGGPGRHECPETTRPLDEVLVEGLEGPGVTGPWALWLSQHHPDQGEIGAVVEGLRGG